MKNGKIKVWLPAIQAGSGADMFTRRLAFALERRGMAAHITWFPWYCELLPFLMQRAAPPIGTDIIFTNSWIGHAFKYTGLPFVVTVHHSIFSPELRPYKSMSQRIYHRLFAEPREMRSLRSANAITAVSEFVADGLRQKQGIEKVEIIHNWVDTVRFQPAQKKSRHDGPFRLLFVGKLTQLKGGDMLAPIMHMLGAAFELQVTADARKCRKMGFPENIFPIGQLSEDELGRRDGSSSAQAGNEWYQPNYG